MEFIGTPEQVTALFCSLAAAQAALKNATKTSTNDEFGHKYATLTDVLDVLRPVLGEQGLAVVQTPCSTKQDSGAPGAYALETVVTHRQGAFVTTTMPILLRHNNMQGLGSAVTFARRYQVSALFNMGLDDDDDGNAACAESSSSSVPTAVPAAKPPVPVQYAGKTTHAAKPTLTVADAIAKVNADESLVSLQSKTSMAKSIFKGDDLKKVLAAIDDRRLVVSAPTEVPRP